VTDEMKRNLEQLVQLKKKKAELSSITRTNNQQIRGLEIAIRREMEDNEMEVLSHEGLTFSLIHRLDISRN
jgi:hypothetical protein